MPSRPGKVTPLIVVFLLSAATMFNFSSKANPKPNPKDKGKEKSSGATKRAASFAGTWYEGDGKKLKLQLDTMLSKAGDESQAKPVDASFDPNPACQQPLMAIIVP